MSFVLVVNLCLCHLDRSPKLGDLEFEKAESYSERRLVEPEGIGRARAQTRVIFDRPREDTYSEERAIANRRVQGTNLGFGVQLGPICVLGFS